jgi:hypothetical protein
MRTLLLAALLLAAPLLASGQELVQDPQDPNVQVAPEAPAPAPTLGARFGKDVTLRPLASVQLVGYRFKDKAVISPIAAGALYELRVKELVGLAVGGAVQLGEGHGLTLQALLTSPDVVPNGSLTAGVSWRIGDPALALAGFAYRFP